MKKTGYIGSICLLCLLLCSCSHSKKISDDTSWKPDLDPTEITVAPDIAEPTPTEQVSDDRQDEEEMSRI